MRHLQIVVLLVALLAAAPALRVQAQEATPATGEERWHFAGAISADSTPLVVDGTLYVGSDAGTLVALDTATGKEQWHYTAPSAVLRSPSFADGVIYAGTDAGLLFALDATTHQKLWEFQGDPEELVGTSGVSNGVIYFHQAKMLWALDAKSGEVRWQQEVNEGGVRCADPFQDLIVTCGANGQVTGLDAATGAVRWTFMTGDNNQPGALVDGVLYVASFDRNVYAIDAATGRERWHVPIDGEIGYGPHVTNGIVYVSTDLGSVYAIGGSESAAAAGLASTPVGPGSASPAPAATPAAGADFPGAFVWRTTGGVMPLSYTTAIAVAPDGTLWVVDGGHNQFQLFAPDGRFLASWGTAGSGEGQFNFTRPQGGAASSLAFRPDGGFYVVDPGNARIQQFDAERHFVRAWGSHGTEDGQFLGPASVALAANGDVYVIDDQRDDVQVFAPEGTFRFAFAGHGRDSTGDGDLGAGTFAADGTFWVADHGHDRLVAFAPDGRFLRSLGSTGSAVGQLRGPLAVAIDAAGHLFVTDGGNARVQVFDATGNVLAVLTGDNAGGTRFGKEPQAIVLDGQGTLYVHDYRDETTYEVPYEAVQKFRLLPPLAP